MKLQTSFTATGPMQNLQTDVRGLEALRSQAAKDPKATAKEVGNQFEALFMQEVMKSMRQATETTGMLENSATQMGTEMLDVQFATKMSGAKGGLGDIIAKQIERQMGGAMAPAISVKASVEPSLTQSPSLKISQLSAPAAAANAPSNIPSGMTRQAEFVQLHTQAAKEAEAKTGIPANFMVAQAAHESGWGRREIKNADGGTSFNVFGIKATSSWKGKVAEVTTTEYINGAPRKVIAQFRAYGSYKESFEDYARMMKESPRYAGVVANASTPEGFAKGLQKAGYATDPAYAEKLTRMINTTLKLQRAFT